MLAAVLLAAPGVRSDPAPRDPAARLQDLAWLAGSWQGARWEAYYTSPRGGVILGTSKEYRPDGTLAMPEFEKIVVEDGRVVLTPYPFTKPAGPFTLVPGPAGTRRARFEDPANDFPAAITYERLDRHRLQVTLEGTVDGKPVSESWILRRR